MSKGIGEKNMNNEIFQKVFDVLQDNINIDWKRIIFYVGYSSNSYSMKYYVDDGAGMYKSCFELPGFSMANATKMFAQIDSVIAKERKSLSDQDKWNVLTMIVDDSGHMQTVFDYTDLSEGSIEYEKKWKEKYIK